LIELLQRISWGPEEDFLNFIFKKNSYPKARSVRSQAIKEVAAAAAKLSVRHTRK
jgi:hypothetical protein